MKVTKSFLDEVMKNDVVALYKGEICPDIDIIHGTVDDFVPIRDSIEFCEEHHIPLHKLREQTIVLKVQDRLKKSSISPMKSSIKLVRTVNK